VIEAFHQTQLEHLTPIEALAVVTGRTPDEKMIDKVRDAKRIVFVPSVHVGPYVGRLGRPHEPYIMFGAHSPEGRAVPGSALNRSELLVRLGTLGDDTRLRVLALLVEHEELCAQDLMERLDTSQSAISRHVRQLVASGYVSERWRDGAKCYRLNRQSINDLLHALERFFAR
jgi:DNA-binding transcriptional ArsR family regulator